MRFSRLLVVALMALALVAYAQNRFEREMQRDIATLQEEVRKLQNSLDAKMAALDVLVKQALDTASKTNTAIAVLESGIRNQLREHEKSVVGPVAGVGTRIDRMAEEFRYVGESVKDLTSRMGKLELQIRDLGNAVKILQAPPQPPPSAAPPGPPAGLSADSLYNNAYRDKTSGNFDLALQQFQDYLKWFANTDYAPNAQYHIGDVYYIKGDLEAALKAFDLVLEKYPDNNKTADAMLMKGKTLLKMGQRGAAGEEFRALLKRFPTGDAAAKARAELKNLSVPSNRKKSK